MAESKTKPNESSVSEYLASRGSEAQIGDCQSLIVLLQRMTGHPPKMWGPSIVGFGSYRYPLANGKFGASCATGFAIRGRELVLYLVAEGTDQAALLQRLGKHKVGKSCLYFKQLSDLDTAVLQQLVAGSLTALSLRYAKHGA